MSKERRDIAVDVREFRSALPSILHQGGMRLAPVTLTVGDFVLSNVHCVERKSISDLFGSFASGRLYTQAESMCRHYKAPCLLIEFDPSKSFCLQNSSELGVEIRADSACSKLSLLTMHFPKLRILWSRGPHETLKIFKDLKMNHEEVDVEKAMEIGRNESVEALLRADKSKGGEEGEEEEDEINESAREMLLRLPGVNVHAARRIMEEVDTLAELALLSREELRKIAGPIVGQKLFTFFHQKIGAT
uniref:ERCC4 domain-containing protein n=1 Tax=Amphora coffeiformis TaxID=265554 RepID=A0A7S3L7V4_9STRA